MVFSALLSTGRHIRTIAIRHSERESRLTFAPALDVSFTRGSARSVADVLCC